MNSSKKWSSVSLYNPFIFIAGYKSFTIGVLVLMLTIFLAFTTGTHYNGLLNVYFAKDTPYVFYFIEQVSHWIFLSGLLFIFGTFLSKSKIRFIDVIGTQAMARSPFLLLPTIRMLPPFESFVMNSIQMNLLIALYIILAMWSITLMFNAYHISCNVKHKPLVASFILAILLSEFFTKALIYITQNNLKL